MTETAPNTDIITQTGRVYLKRIPGGGYQVVSPEGTEAFDEYLLAYFAYLDAIGWTDKRG